MRLRQTGALLRDRSWRPVCWKALAVALFIGAVVSGQIGKGDSGAVGIASVTRHRDLEGKSCDVQRGFWENIVICGPAPYVDELLSLCCRLGIGERNKVPVAFDAGFRGRSQRDGLTFVGRNIPPVVWEIPILWQFSVPHNEISVIDEIPRGSVTRIFPDHGEAPTIDFPAFGVAVEEIPRSCGNKSALPGNERAFRYLCAFLSSIGGFGGNGFRSKQKQDLKSSNDKQPETEYRKPEGKKGYGIDERPAPNYREPLPEGFLLFILVVALPLGALLGGLVFLLAWWFR